MENWGEIKITLIDSFDFVNLFYELIDDESGFINNINILLESYKSNNLYGLRVIETSKMYEMRIGIDPIFCKNSFYLLPCFCIKDNNECVIIWVHKRARNMGFGKKLIKLLNINKVKVSNILPESIGFWKKFGCEIMNIIDNNGKTYNTNDLKNLTKD